MVKSDPAAAFFLVWRDDPPFSGKLRGIRFPTESPETGRITAKGCIMEAQRVDSAGKPFFQPSPAMRQRYLDVRKDELEAFLAYAKGNVWKEVIVIANHVRGTGAMYGFVNIGDAAENLAKAIQNGDSKCIEYAERYVDAVNASYV